MFVPAATNLAALGLRTTTASGSFSLTRRRPAPQNHTLGMGSLGQRSRTRRFPYEYAAFGKHVPRLPSCGPVSINSLGSNNTHSPRSIAHGHSQHDRDSLPPLCRLPFPARKERWRVRLAQGPGPPRCNPIRTSRLSKHQGPQTRGDKSGSPRYVSGVIIRLPLVQWLRREPDPSARSLVRIWTYRVISWVR